MAESPHYLDLRLRQQSGTGLSKIGVTFTEDTDRRNPLVETTRELLREYMQNAHELNEECIRVTGQNFHNCEMRNPLWFEWCHDKQHICCVGYFCDAVLCTRGIPMGYCDILHLPGAQDIYAAPSKLEWNQFVG